MQRVWRRDEAGRKIGTLRGVLVAVGGNPLDAHVLRMTCSMLKGTKTPLYAVHVIEMPWTDAVDSTPEEEVSIEADRLLEHASEVVSECGYKVETELLQARAAGAAIVDEAAARGCDLIVVGLPYKREYGEFSMGETVPYVLEHSPVPVWVIRGPQV